MSDDRDIVDRMIDLSAARREGTGDVGRWDGKMIREAIDEIERLRDAIRRLADQDATLSVCDGNVTVTMEAWVSVSDRLPILGMEVLVTNDCWIRIAYWGDPSSTTSHKDGWRMTGRGKLDTAKPPSHWMLLPWHAPFPRPHGTEGGAA